MWYPWVLLLIVTLVFGVAQWRTRQARARDAAAFERLVAESRLEALRTQLHPHFLFNALNTISAHIEHDPRRARGLLDQLGTLLRMSLEHARERETPLSRELTFIACYLELQKARFDDRFDVVTTVDPDVADALVPSLILQPLVENAIRHGLTGQSSAGSPSAGHSGQTGRIEIRAWRDRNFLQLHVTDDGLGLPVDWDPENGLGVGLSNTRERLHRLYGDSQRFAIVGRPGSGVEVTLTLPFRQRDDAAPVAEFTTAAGARTRTAADSPGS